MKQEGKKNVQTSLRRKRKKKKKQGGKGEKGEGDKNRSRFINSPFFPPSSFLPRNISFPSEIFFNFAGLRGCEAAVKEEGREKKGRRPQ